MFKRAFLCIAALSIVRAQDEPKPPAFLAADVHATPPDSKGIAPGNLRDTQYEVRGMTMLFILQRAYNLDSDHILGGPRRLDMDKYDIIAKVPPGTKADAAPEMLKALLAERFHLVAKETTRPMVSYALALGKGKHKLKPAEGSESRCGFSSNSQDSGQTMMHLTCKAYSTTMLANIMRSLGNGFITSAVTDQTGLQGNWDFEMDVIPPGLAGTSSANLMSAVENQLGLKLEQKKTDQPVLVIESMDTMPTPNAPGVAESMAPPPPPMTLEVATIKPNAPGGQLIGGFLVRSDQQGGTMTLEGRGIRISTLIQQGWSLTPDRMIGLPPGIDDQLLDIIVKMDGQPGVLSTATIGPIFQALLKDRFKLVAHLEDRPLDAYKLVAVKPKMAKADPPNRAGCKEGPIQNPRETSPPRITYTCRNMTMAEFAERLQGMSFGTIRTPVVEATKLEGMFDFTLTTSLPSAMTQALAGPATAAPAPPPTGGTAVAPLASDPSDAITIFEAVSSQLGLKLELEKRPLPVLIIDHLEKTPTEN